jgi:hypothetical protein
VALPVPADAGPAQNAKPGTPAQRPAVGPVVPLTATNVGSDELLGDGRQNRPPAADVSVSRVLTKGEPIAAPTGRADDFGWPPRGVNIDTNLPDAPMPSALPASETPEKPGAGRRAQTGAQASGANPAGESKAQRRARTGTAEPFRLPFFFPNLFR